MLSFKQFSVLLSALLFSSWLSIGYAQQIDDLGTLTPVAVSFDGSKVAGTLNLSSYLWSAQGGLQNIGTVPSYSYYTNAKDITGGSTIVGNASASGAFGGTVPFIWNGTSIAQVPGLNNQLLGISADGNVIFGSNYRFQDGALTNLTGGSVTAINADGSVLVGAGSHALRWTNNGTAWTAQDLGSLGTDTYSYASVVSGNGSVVYGYTQSSAGQSVTTFRWTSQSGMTSLGFCQGGFRPAATNYDGSVMISNGGCFGQAPAVWRQDSGWHDLTDYVSAHGINVADWNLYSVTDISGDGNVIVGTGYYLNGWHGYRIVLDAPLPTAATSIEFADPNPYGVFNPALPEPQRYPSANSPEAVISWTPQVMAAAPITQGAVTDDVTRLLVRWRVPSNGTVSLQLSDEVGLPLNAGKLGMPGQVPSTTSLTALVPTQIAGQWYVFASYVVPTDFDRGNRDAALTYRNVVVTGRFQPISGSPTQSKATLRLVRPPVLLLHGWRGDSKSWDLSLQHMVPGFITYAADYSGSNEFAFQANVWRARQGAERAVNIARHLGYAATKATVIAHSMGGILARLHSAGRNGDYYRADNLGQGDFYKLITLYTPHLGSAFACILERLQTFWTIATGSPPLCFGCGAVHDLRPDSDEIQHLPAAPVPSHAIAGLAGSPAISSLPLGIGSPAFRDPLGRVLFRVISIINNNLPSLLGSSQNDLIVTQTSAYGGLSGAAASSVPFQLHTGNDWFIGIHTGAGTQQYIGSQVLEPLLRAPLRSSIFAPSLPANSNVAVPLTCSTVQSAPELATNGGIALSVNPDSQSVAPGGIVNMSVTRTGTFQPSVVYIASSLGVTRVTTLPASVTLPVDVNAFGDYTVQAVAVDSANRVAVSALAPFQVVSNATLGSLEATTSWNTLGCPNEEENLSMRGYFSDGSVRDITASNSGTTYTSLDDSVVTVDAEGRLVARGNGSTTVRVSNSGLTNIVTVAVSPAWCVRQGYCRADFDHNGTLAVQDIFTYLGAWFAQNLSADFNQNGTIEVNDIFAFLNAWFAGCS